MNPINPSGARLDYFRDATESAPTEHLLFRFERSMELGRAEIHLLSQLCLELGFPREEPRLRGVIPESSTAL